MPQALMNKTIEAYERGDPNRKQILREYYEALSQEADAFVASAQAKGMGDREICELLGLKV